MGTPAQRLESERASYPAMQVDEILVWRKWLLANQQAYDRFEYNVYVGVDRDPGEAFTPAVRQWAINVRKLRLDAVGWQGTRATIFEVKRVAGPENVGQLFTYRAEWNATGLVPRDPTLVLVCGSASPNIIAAVGAAGIIIMVVPGIDFSVLGPGRIIPPAQ